jgi:hypothetical protein
MPKIGEAPSSRLISATIPDKAAGSPGPFERKTPSGANEITSSADVRAGTTVTSHPTAAR